METEPELTTELIEIIRELHAFAGATALSKMLEDHETDGQNWHVIDVQPCAWFPIGISWYVHVQYGDTTQKHWLYVTWEEIFAYRLKVAMARRDDAL